MDPSNDITAEPLCGGLPRLNIGGLGESNSRGNEYNGSKHCKPYIAQFTESLRQNEDCRDFRGEWEGTKLVLYGRIHWLLYWLKLQM